MDKGLTLLTYQEIKAEFARVSLLVDNAKIIALPPDASDAEISSATDVVKEELSRLINRSKHLPQVSDYDWVLTSECELSPYELVMQYLIIAILAEIPPDHPDLVNFKPTVLRFVRGASFSSVGIPGHSVNFICISIGFTKFIQAVFGLILDLHKFGKEKTRNGLVCATNHIFGQDAEAALRIKTHGEIARVIFSGPEGGVYLAGYGSSIRERLNSPEIFQVSLLPHGYEAAEAFIICHELGHLLHGHQLSLGRDSRQEREADQAAISLLLCASALGEEYRAYPIIGPPLFFQIARLYELIRRFRQVISDLQGMTGEVLRPEFELHVRLMSVVNDLKEFVGKPAAHRSAEIASELTVIIAGFQQCMERFIGLDPPLDKFL
jgi:hypothetical protein